MNGPTNGSANLRPYYDHDTFNAGYSVIYKPGVGLVDPLDGKRLAATLFEGLGPGKGIGLRGANSGGGLGATGGAINANSSAAGLGGKNYAYDLEIQEYFDVSNLTELLKNLVWSFVRNYSKALMSQPLELVRLVLQVGQFGKAESKSVPTAVLDESDSEYEINYFQTAGEAAEVNEWSTPSMASSQGESQKLSRSQRHKPKPTKKIQPTSTHTIDVLSAMMTAEGPMALFRGVNATFIFLTLSHTIEAWITGLVSPFLGIPDPFFLDLTHLPDPWKLLLLLVGACVATGLILMPLDLIRVKLMVTHFGSKSTRSVRELLRNFPPLAPPPQVVVLTTLHQLLASVFRRAAPYILFIRYNIDLYNSPGVYTVMNLGALLMEFFIKLPVENVLRKEQVRWLLSNKNDPRGVVTVTEDDLVVHSEGDDFGSADVNVYTAAGARIVVGNLYNGWRVGLLNLLAVWGYALVNTNTTDPERL
ncbi:uncharacterized protein CANTADRAFT_52185 [Suhomyces tanzawaensis NRRL Y-17324]|uniref:Mitochondrial carrier n=1 Tax=Suhomyces tanzawaensis NRRL Y-17324 TaxID=984487 RepID=A0A1E4SI68_9ASCO|nr:uncharacterized protein CANTADRAFT_52185 [Suhomyces tanzawaensis NRRL Y-17324]ODV79122.1 hypothetical protein CANTADRAFT_52185 [Suhomyces tanzawaensis NRRL Y-17324]